MSASIREQVARSIQYQRQSGDGADAYDLGDAALAVVRAAVLTEIDRRIAEITEWQENACYALTDLRAVVAELLGV